MILSKVKTSITTEKYIRKLENIPKQARNPNILSTLILDGSLPIFKHLH